MDFIHGVVIVWVLLIWICVDIVWILCGYCVDINGGIVSIGVRHHGGGTVANCSSVAEAVRVYVLLYY